MKEDVGSTVEYFDGDVMAATVWEKKYALRDENGEAIEHTPTDMHHRMAKYFADVEAKYDIAEKGAIDKSKLSEYGQERKPLTEDEIFKLFDHFKYVVPGGSVMSGLGSTLPVSLSNCWVIDSLNDSIDGIFNTCNEMSQLFKRRGGVGFDISKLRPSGAKVNNSAKYSTGAVSFMDLFSTVTTTIAQNGRRGAAMLSIHIDHPDAKEFIEKKQDLTKVTGANISVQIGDDFMNAVINDTDFYQTWPIDKKVNVDESAEYDTLVETTDEDGNKAYFKKIRAKELWNTLVHCAWNTAEPGILFKTKHYNYSPDGIYDRFRGTSTNPCLVGDTMIQTDKGPIAIKDIVERMKEGETFRVLTFNEVSKENEYKDVESGQMTKSDANVIEIETEDGQKLRLTPDHKVYTENRGWVEASKLVETDVLLAI